MGTPKSKGSERDIPMSKAAFEILQSAKDKNIIVNGKAVSFNVNGNDIIYSDTAKDVLIMSLIDSFNMGRIRGIQQERKRRNNKK